MSKTFSVADVAAHKDANAGMYIIVDENVYDVTGDSPFSLSRPSHFLSQSHHVPDPPLHPAIPRILSKGTRERKLMGRWNRIRRRTPRRLENSEAGSGQGCDEAVLEIS